MKGVYIFLFSTIFVFIFISLYNQATNIKLPFIKDKKDIVNLFAKSRKEVKSLVKDAIDQANYNLDLIYNIKDKDRNFKNTMILLDRAKANFDYKLNLIQVLTMVSPDKDIRDACHESILELSDFYLNNFSQNKRLYKSLKSYDVNRKNLNENLKDFQEFFIKEVFDSYKKAGLEKDDNITKEIKEVLKELSSLTLEFEKNINISNRCIKALEEDLKGLDKDFINSLKKSEDNLYTLGVDYPTFFKVIEECSVEKTREALWYEFNLRGFPENKQILIDIVKLRNKLANLLDFKTYSHLDISDQMAKNPDKVYDFLKEVSLKCKERALKEIEILKQDLPESIELLNNKIKPWDLKFILNNYKKKHLMLDENIISEYFPIDYTLNALLNIYERFFGLKFEKFDLKNLWHEDVQAFRVYRDNKFIGNLLLDLYPRENKYTHACQAGIIPSVKDENNNIICPALVLVITNFTKPCLNKPALLRRQEVVTFFHECGHAIHSLLGSTELVSHSGTSVKGDFVEMPSQMLEDWITDKDILKLISCHYKTKESLPDNIIEQLQKTNNAFLATSILSQIAYSLVSIDLFNNLEKDIDNIWKDSHSILNEMFSHCSDYGYCSFGHLTGYGSKYYGYLWSKVYAKDMFKKIKESGLLNREIGDIYASKVLSQGGSKDPEVLLKDFLGRDPNSKAFFDDLESLI